MSDLSFLSQMQSDINQGKIQGFLDLEERGELLVMDFDVERGDNGGSQFVFWVTLAGKTDCYKKVWVNIPKPDAKDAAKFMGFQRIGKTVFGCVGADPRKHQIDAVIAKIKDILGKNSIKCAYETETRDYVNSRTGKNAQSKDLVSLQWIGVADKIPFTRPTPGANPRPNASAPSYHAGFDEVPF